MSRISCRAVDSCSRAVQQPVGQRNRQRVSRDAGAARCILEALFMEACCPRALQQLLASPRTPTGVPRATTGDLIPKITTDDAQGSPGATPRRASGIIGVEPGRMGEDAGRCASRHRQGARLSRVSRPSTCSARSDAAAPDGTIRVTSPPGSKRSQRPSPTSSATR